MRQTLTTDRLILRRWRATDREPFQTINADRRVMEFFPALLTPEETVQSIARIEKHFDRLGFGLYAAELIETKTFIGFIGLSFPAFEAPFMPAVEIGWRLAFDYWGRGLASEGACAVVRYAFETIQLPSLVSFTAPANLRSRRVMERIGMVHDSGGDFDHPGLPEGHLLRRHVLYRLYPHAGEERAAGGSEAENYE
jgi:RimJ/RimL family protein N-acetyltransferase